METTINEPTRLYKVYRLLVIPAILWYVWNMQYLFTASEGETVIYAMWGRYFIFFAAIPLCIVLGIAIMRNRPGNVIGPALIVYAGALSSEAIFDLALPAAQAHVNLLVLWLFMWTSNVVVAGHFPGGNIYPRWLAVPVYAFIAVCIATGFIILLSAPTAYGASAVTESAIEQANPFLIERLAPLGDAMQEGLQDTVLGIVNLGMILLLVIRYLRTTTLERKQMRWLPVGIIVATVAVSAQYTANVTDEVVVTSTIGLIVGTLTLPVAIAIGVLFYRLWDVDVIIRRTLVYAVVSALLAGTYFVIVFTAQSLLSGFFDDNNTLLIVMSTLAVAVLFNPVRERVQRVIDRLFYRKRYDAQEILDSFSDHLRGAMEPDAIQAQLVQSVTQTIQPKSISFWQIERRP